MGRRRNLTVRTRAFVTRILFDGRRAVGVESTTGGRHPSVEGRRDHPGRRRDQHTPTAAAVRGRSGRRPGGARDPRRARPARCRRAPAGPSRGVHPVHAARSRSRCSRRPPRSGAARSSGPSGCSCAAARAPRTTSRAAGSRAATTMWPTRTSCSTSCRWRSATTGAPERAGHGYQVHVGPMYSDARGSVKVTSTDPHGPSGAPLQLPLDRPGPAGMGGGHPGGPPHPGPARDGRVRRWRDVARARRWRRTRRSSTGSATMRRQRCTRRARRGWGSTSASVIDPLTMRVHGLDGLRVVDASVDAVRDQWQHLRPGHDARREGRRPDPGRNARCRPSTSRSTGIDRPEPVSGRHWRRHEQDAETARGT